LPDRSTARLKASPVQTYTVFSRFLRVREYSARTAFPVSALAIAVLRGTGCYLLAGRCQPAGAIAAATSVLAAADLTARTGAPMKGRRDELGQLMRDFDRMAERIEAVMDSQSRCLRRLLTSSVLRCATDVLRSGWHEQAAPERKAP